MQNVVLEEHVVEHVKLMVEVAVITLKVEHVLDVQQIQSVVAVGMLIPPNLIGMEVPV